MTTRPARTRLLLLVQKHPRVWKLIQRTRRSRVVPRYRHDDNGFALVFVALLLLVVPLLLAYFLTIGTMLIARSRLQTMAELSAAAGGRIVAEAIAKKATQNVEENIFAPPQGDEVKHPERYLTPTDRADIQSGAEVQQAVVAAATQSIQKNNVAAWDDVASSFVFPVASNTCDGAKLGGVGNQKSVEVSVIVTHAEPLFLSKLSAVFTGTSEIALSANSFYSVVVCP